MNTQLKYFKFNVDKNKERREKIQALLIEMRKSGDYLRDAVLYDLIRRVGKL